MNNPNQKPDGGRKAPAKRMSEPANRKGGKPAAAGITIQKKAEAYKSIPKAKRIDRSYGEKKAAGTGKRMNVKARTSRS